MRKPFKIAYIDDEPSIVSLFVEDFSLPTIEVRGYSDPDDAITAVRAFAPDLVFIDYLLPRYTGDQIAMLLPKNMRKVLVTGDLLVQPIIDFDRVFYKPYDFDEIKEYILSLATKAV